MEGARETTTRQRTRPVRPPRNSALFVHFLHGREQCGPAKSLSRYQVRGDPLIPPDLEAPQAVSRAVADRSVAGVPRAVFCSAEKSEVWTNMISKLISAIKDGHQVTDRLKRSTYAASSSVSTFRPA
jgi:hypothetical protein